MSQTGGNLRATKEAVQPSLWDRLQDDLPGVASEIDGLRRQIENELGAERLAVLLGRNAGGDEDLTKVQRQGLARLRFLEGRRDKLETRTIVVSAEILREAVRRDIEMLFNTERFEADLMLSDREYAMAPDNPPSLQGFDEVRRSVINFGVPSFSGRSTRDFDREKLAREIKELRFSPAPNMSSAIPT